MKTLNKLSIKRSLLPVLLLVLCVACASQKPALRASIYKFDFNENSYSIRSILPNNNSTFFNELVGDNFVAKDYDQDGYIDEITTGKIDFSRAQEIYDHALATLKEQNKLKENPIKPKIYYQENSKYHFEIKSFRSAKSGAFNELKVIQKGKLVNPEITICIDHQADGKLDEIVSGMISLKQMQEFYSELIEQGITNQSLSEIDNMILVSK